MHHLIAAAYSKRIIVVCYNLGLTFVVLTVIFSNIVLNNSIAKVWECGQVRQCKKHKQSLRDCKHQSHTVTVSGKLARQGGVA